MRAPGAPAPSGAVTSAAEAATGINVAPSDGAPSPEAGGVTSAVNGSITSRGLDGPGATGAVAGANEAVDDADACAGGAAAASGAMLGAVLGGS